MTITTPRFNDTWDDVLPLICMRYRTSINETTGFSPYHIVFGRDPELHEQDVFNTETAPACEADYLLRMKDSMDVIRSEVFNASEATALRNKDRRLQQYRPVKYSVGDYCLVWSPKAAEPLPDGYSRKPKMLDRWSLPHRIIAKGDRPDYYIIKDDKGEEQDIRSDSMTPYHFFTDNKPSVSARRRFTKHERKLLRINQDTYLPPLLRHSLLAIFPLTIKNQPAFGVGKVIGNNEEENSFDLHWYSNDHDDVHGSYMPVWMTLEGKWYCKDTSNHPSHRPMTTGECYPAPIRQKDVADVGFSLMVDGRIPFRVLQRISNNTEFKWKLPATYTEEQHTAQVAVK